MKITLIDAGKRFNRDWIFRHLSFEFKTGRSYAITGSNGSGKSTLLQAIAGAIDLSEGTVKYENGDAGISPERAYQYISFAAPYLELIEEMNLPEFLNFHAGFKPFLPSLNTATIISLLGLQGADHKQIRNFSSGMKQRVKLAQSIFSDTPVVLLDEPCTNLDADGIALYKKLIGDYCTGRLVIVSSNDRQEYDFCEEAIPIMDYK
ncbi:MAG: ATP-binding cassette domain-containing protein [Puia sp.]|nr:ATP-binding cassette domain-containing protein [Puia sp.]